MKPIAIASYGRAIFGLVLALLASTQLAGVPTRQWSQGDPSGEEQYALEVINRIRLDSVSAANFYIGETVTKPIVAGAISGQFTRDANNLQVTGAAAVRLMAAADLANYNANLGQTRTAPPKPPLALYPLFSQQARTRDADVLSTDGSTGAGFFNTAGANLPTTVINPRALVLLPANAEATPAFSGPNATGGTASVRAGGLTGTGAFDRSELLFSVNYYDPLITLRETFIMRGASLQTWLDDCYTTTRTGFGGAATFSYGRMRMIGINLSSARTGSPGAGSRILTVYGTDNEAFQTSDLPFGTDTVFITGVIYRDNDKDGDYTPGEGIGGVTITPNNGDWFAITSSSGGFAIPVRKNSGVYTVTASGNGVNTSNVVTVGSDSVKLDFVLQNTTKPVQITVAGTDGINQFTGLSTRGVAEPGDNALIGGFIISGSGTKRVLIRGVANSLTQYGLNGVLRKPLLTLYNSKSEVIKTARTQDTYNIAYSAGSPPVVTVKPELAAVFQQVGDFALITTNAPANSLSGPNMRFAGESDGGRPAGDTAMVIDLAPGLYSVSITPDADTENPNSDYYPSGSTVMATSGNSGLVLLEIYDVTPNSGGRFAGLSTRGKIETGARQMIVGFIFAGTGHRRVLVRGVGPTMKSLGVVAALDDPAIDLYNDANQVVLTNDDWGYSTWADQSVTVADAVGEFALPDGSRDGVILACLTPGLYSAGVRSATGQTGIGLAEIYESQ